MNREKALEYLDDTLNYDDMEEAQELSDDDLQTLISDNFYEYIDSQLQSIADFIYVICNRLSSTFEQDYADSSASKITHRELDEMEKEINDLADEYEAYQEATYGE